MLILHENPFFRITIPFIIGIAFFNFFNIYIVIPIILLLVSLTFFIIRTFLSQYYLYRFRWIDTFVVFLMFFSAGIIMIWFNRTIQNVQKTIRFAPNKQYVLLAKVDSEIAETKNTFKSIITVEAVFNDSIFVRHKEKILVYFPKDSAISLLKYGTRIFLRATLQEPRKPSHPYAFDYRAYLKRMGINYTSFVSPDHIKILEHSDRNNIKTLALATKQKILHTLKNQLEDSLVYGVASALILGHRDALDADVREKFANAGAIHIMCVSGLHVGILYVFISWLMKLLPLNKRSKAFRILDTLFSLSLIWFFALITGLSPSVTRASMMFSFVAIGKLVENRIPVMNSLAASAFILLAINPDNLFLPGFQLSYLAVIGIVNIYPILKKWFITKRKIFKYLIDIVLVSIAAQVATTPISLFYFHQIPNYFILTNIIAIPLATIIMFTSIAYIVFYYVPILGYIIQFSLVQEIKLLTTSIDMIQSLPGATIKNFFISDIQFIFLFISIIFFVSYLNSKSFLKFAGVMLSLIIFFSIHSARIITSLKNQECIIPNAKNIWLVARISNQCYFVVNNKTEEVNKIIESQYKTYFARYNIKKYHLINLDTTIKINKFLFYYPFVIFNDKILWFITSVKKKMPFEPEFAILTPKEYVNFNSINEIVPKAKIIATSDNRHKTIEKWQKLSKTYNFIFHATIHDGPFSIK